MKPKQNNKNKGWNNNNKRLKQQQQQQQRDHQQQQQPSVGGELKGSRNDDAEAAETTEVMTSSVVEYSAATTQNAERHIPSNNSDNQTSTHSPGGDTDHVTNRCDDDVIFDVEVADIVNAATAVNRDLRVNEVTTSDSGVTEVVTSDPDNTGVITELIMSKTFTESTHPGREFVPIRRDADDVIDDAISLLPAESGDFTTVKEVMTSDPGVTEVVTSDPDNKEVITELIMSKTFTESTHPGREFVPIRSDADDVIDDVSNPLPAESGDFTTLTVRCELFSQPSATAETTSGRRVVTSPDSVKAARGHVRDLTSEFRHLQSLLDNVTSSAAATDDVDTSSEEELDDDWRQPSAETRVIYHYHLRERPSTGRRWIRRTDDTTPEDLNTQHVVDVVDVVDVVEEEKRRQQQSEPHHETCLELGSQSVEELRTQQEERVVELVTEDRT